MTYTLPPDLCNRPKNVVRLKNPAQLPTFKTAQQVSETKKAFGAIQTPAKAKGGSGVGTVVVLALLAVVFIVVLFKVTETPNTPVATHAVKTVPSVTVTRSPAVQPANPAPYNVMTDVGASVQMSNTPEPDHD
jgi:hypothetical protein